MCGVAGQCIHALALTGREDTLSVFAKASRQAPR
jgi:hypothetical protein